MAIAYDDRFRRRVVAAVRTDPWSIQAVAAAYSVCHQTVMRWALSAGIKVPPAAERMRRGGLVGTIRRWGDPTPRHRAICRKLAKREPWRQIARDLQVSLGTISAARRRNSG